MSFFDDIKSRFGAGRGSASEPYGDDQYDDYYGEDGDAGYEDYPAGYGQPAQDTYRGYEPSDSGNGMLGQTRRGEAESVAVYTRSGQLVGEADRHASSYGAPTATGRDGAYRPGAYDTPSSYAQAQSQRAAMSSVPTPAAPTSTEARVSAVLEGTPQLPAYVLRPESYDDVETVVRRVSPSRSCSRVCAPRSPSASSTSATASPVDLERAFARWATVYSLFCRRAARSNRPISPTSAKMAILSSRSRLT